MKFYLPTDKVDSSCMIKSYHQFKDTAENNLTDNIEYNMAETIM